MNHHSHTYVTFYCPQSFTVLRSSVDNTMAPRDRVPAHCRLGPTAILTAGFIPHATASTVRAASAVRTDPQVAALLATLQADAGSVGLADALADGPITAANWRTSLAPVFAKSAKFTGYTQAPGRLRGAVLAGTLRLPATIDLAGNVTVVARRLQLSGHTLTIHAHGHAIHFYPIDSVTTGGTKVGVTTTAIMTASSSPIIISANGQIGASGTDGEDFGGNCDGGNGGNGTFGRSLPPCQDRRYGYR